MNNWKTRPASDKASFDNNTFGVKDRFKTNSEKRRLFMSWGKLCDDRATFSPFEASSILGNLFLLGWSEGHPRLEAVLHGYISFPVVCYGINAFAIYRSRRIRPKPDHVHLAHTVITIHEVENCVVFLEMRNIILRESFLSKDKCLVIELR